MESLVVIFLFLSVCLVWFIPLIMLIKSDRTSGGTKFLWILVFLFVSWFAWLAYILLVPKQQPTNKFAKTH